MVNNRGGQKRKEKMVLLEYFGTVFGMHSPPFRFFDEGKRDRAYNTHIKVSKFCTRRKRVEF